MTIAARLRAAREKRGLTAKKLSELAGLSNSYVSQIERTVDEHPAGAATIESPGLDKVSRLADQLQVPAEWLAFGSGPDPLVTEAEDEGADANPKAAVSRAGAQG